MCVFGYASDQSSTWFFPPLLVLIGWFGERIVERKKYPNAPEEVRDSKKTLLTFALYTFVAVLGFRLIGQFVPYVSPFARSVGLGVLDVTVFAFGIAAAISETQFFQGFILELFLCVPLKNFKVKLFGREIVLSKAGRQPWLFASFEGALFAAGYHIFRYHGNFKRKTQWRRRLHYHHSSYNDG